MRRTLFFIVVVLFAATSFASIPRASMLDAASPAVESLSETRVWASDVLAPFERPATSELSRAVRRACGDFSTTSASGLRCFLSVDPEMNIKLSLREPQMWNRYSYVVNNPLRYTDPTGRYKCKGSTADCATIEEAVQKVRTAAANLPAGSEEQRRAAATAKLYGKLGQRTGVVVALGTVQANAVAETSTARFIFKTTTVTVDLNVARNVFGTSFATELGAVMGHEMQHGIDQRSGANQGNTRADAKARELRAFTTQSYINQGLGVDSRYRIWTVAGGRNDAEIESNAERGAGVQCQNAGGCPP